MKIKKQEMVFDFDSIVISFMLGFTVCLYLLY